MRRPQSEAIAVALRTGVVVTRRNAVQGNEDLRVEKANSDGRQTALMVFARIVELPRGYFAPAIIVPDELPSAPLIFRSPHDQEHATSSGCHPGRAGTFHGRRITMSRVKGSRLMTNFAASHLAEWPTNNATLRP